MSLFIQSDGSVCQNWVSRRRKTAKRKEKHALISLYLGLNYTSELGKVCVWDKNRSGWNPDERTWPSVFSRALQIIHNTQQGFRLGLNLLMSSLPQKEEKKTFLNLKIQVCQFLCSSSKGPWSPFFFLNYHNLFSFCKKDFFSSLLTYILVSDVFCLDVGLCYLLLLVLALNTLVLHGGLKKTHHGTLCLRLVTSFYFLFFIF